MLIRGEPVKKVAAGLIDGLEPAVKRPKMRLSVSKWEPRRAQRSFSTGSVVTLLFPEAPVEGEVLELDELWSFVYRKKEREGVGMARPVPKDAPGRGFRDGG